MNIDEYINRIDILPVITIYFTIDTNGFLAIRTIQLTDTISMESAWTEYHRPIS